MSQVIVKDADLQFVYRNAWWQNRIERNEMYWKKLISIDVVIWLDDSYAEDLILFLIDWINGEEKKRKFFFLAFSLLFSSVPIGYERRKRENLFGALVYNH